MLLANNVVSSCFLKYCDIILANVRLGASNLPLRLFFGCVVKREEEQLIAVWPHESFASERPLLGVPRTIVAANLFCISFADPWVGLRPQRRLAGF